MAQSDIGTLGVPLHDPAVGIGRCLETGLSVSQALFSLRPSRSRFLHLMGSFYGNRWSATMIIWPLGLIPTLR